MDPITVKDLKKLLNTAPEEAVVRAGGVEIVQVEFVQDLRVPAKQFFDLYSDDDE